MSRYIKDFFEGMIMTIYRMGGLAAIFMGIYMLCILHTSLYVWLGIVAFFVAMFLIVTGIVTTWLFGWYDRTLDEDSKKLRGALEGEKNE